VEYFTGLTLIKKSARTDVKSVDEEKEATYQQVYRIEIFGGYLPVVTIDRDEAKTAGDCKTNKSQVTYPVAYLNKNLLFKTKYPYKYT
jgi:hypothetical protein